MLTLILRALIVGLCLFFSASTSGNQALQAQIDKRCRKACITATELLAIAKENGKHYRINESYIIALVEKESGYRPKAKRTENGLSVGLMQIQVRWHRDKIHGRDVSDPDTNVSIGAQILGTCGAKHAYDPTKTLMCYNGYRSREYARKVIARATELHSILNN